MSSWLQYEALKFVSFPTQVLAKASKIIPVMLMGKIISSKSYEFYEYLTALLISLGMILFLAGSSDNIQVMKESGATSVTAAGLSGLVILVSYMVFDSFTSNWQSELFRTYRISSCRMMAGVNLFSLILTGISLLQQGSLSQSAHFLFEHPDFGKDCLVLSICSAVGQLFIYYTIGNFGAVIFVIIMTIRQALAVLLSCIFYDHPISGLGIVGVIIVFLSIFLRIYCSFRMKQVRRKPVTVSLTSSGFVSTCIF
jgi:adenosine 3'-phospho 5'-phosphosulfate transporter B2